MRILTLALRFIAITLATLHFSTLYAAEVSPPLTQKLAAQLIADQSGHKVLSTTVDKDDETLFRVKTLSEEGHVKTYQVDSMTGQVLK